jgi:hypothetical protein
MHRDYNQNQTLDEKYFRNEEEAKIEARNEARLRRRQEMLKLDLAFRSYEYQVLLCKQQIDSRDRRIGELEQKNADCEKRLLEHEKKIMELEKQLDLKNKQLELKECMNNKYHFEIQNLKSVVTTRTNEKTLLEKQLMAIEANMKNKEYQTKNPSLMSKTNLFDENFNENEFDSFVESNLNEMDEEDEEDVNDYREQLNLKTPSIHKFSSYQNLPTNKWTKKPQYSISSATCRIVERNKTQAQPNVQQTKMNINQPLSAQMQKKKKSAVLSERNLNELNLDHNDQEKLFTNKTKDSKLSLKPSTLKRIFVNRFSLSR